jgi:hypothetical protein
VAEYRSTGMVTSPKLIAPFQSGRAMGEKCPAGRFR